MSVEQKIDENLPFDEDLVLDIYRSNKDTGSSSLILSSKSLPLLPYINAVRLSSKAVMDFDTLLDKSATRILCYGYIETHVSASLEEINREVSKAAELGLLGFEQPSQPGKVCGITDVCIYKHKTNPFDGCVPLVGLAHTNLRLERFSNFGIFAYPFFREYAPEQLWPALKPKARIVINHISATDIPLDNSDNWENKIDGRLITKSYQRSFRFWFWR